MLILSLGSNLGNRLHHLRCAVDLIRQRWIPDLRTSIVLETEALLMPGSPLEWNKPFLNMLVYGTYEGDPHALLAGLKNIEHELGRIEPYARWSPRVIDIDILVLNEQCVSTPTLTIPHPGIMDRPFLLHLLALTHPTQMMNGRTWAEHAAACSMPQWRQSMVLSPQLVGIVNVTPDSFSDGGMYYNPQDAVDHVWKLLADGASVVDIGAQSTRPGAAVISTDEEWARLQPVLEALRSDMANQHVRVSLDSFQSDIIRRALDYPIEWVNDVTGRLDEDILQLVAEKGCKLVAMHALSVPAVSCEYVAGDPVEAVNTWIDLQMEKWHRCGLPVGSVIVDPGIGFGKSVYQNIQLLSRLGELRKHGCCLLVGHSRKSWIGAFNNQPSVARDVESIAVAQAVAPHVDYLRVHDVAGHMRAMSITNQLAHFAGMTI